MQPRLFLSTGTLALGLISSAASTETASVTHPEFSPDQITHFQEKVKPILMENCFRCHGGTDARGETRVRSNFQIISRLGILKGGDYGPSYDPENPAASHLLEMLSYDSDEHQMPPSGKLPANQIATLTKWMEDGMPWTPEDIDLLAEVESHDESRTEVNEFTKNFWSYKPMERPEIPEVDSPEWQKNPIDALVLDKLHAEGLEPNAPASREVLVRRAYYNLTGLAPSPAEVSEFVNDPRPNDEAWAALVDSLLASPHYGETWGRHWLDVVRYAESNGFERDSEKEHIWRYRDYVINAFNQDKPYNQFVIEQLAGDEIDEPTVESQVATGYHRLMQWDDEPADGLIHRYDVLDDNVRTTSEGFLAMTVGCARCHDHKGDPIPQTDYYSFMAFFHGVTQMNNQQTIESIATPTEANEAQALIEAHEAKLADLRAEFTAIQERALDRLRSERPELTKEFQILIPDSREEGQEWAYTTEQPSDNWSDVGFRADTWETGKAPFGKSLPGINTEWDSSGIWLQKTFGLTEVPKTLSLTLFNDEDVEIYLNGRLILETDGFVTEYAQHDLDEEALAALQTGRNVIAVHCQHTGGGQKIDVGLSTGFTQRDLVRVLRKQGSDVMSEEELDRYRSLSKEIREMEREKPEPGIKAMVVQEHPEPEPMQVHLRGNPHVLGKEVAPSFPVIFANGEVVEPEITPRGDSSGRRRALAEWIASDDNPRTARVMMNRLWQHHFGRGICPTPNDFGFLGEEATHPELLDWLATEFISKGWSIKEMQRILMNSQTYRMSSAPNELALAKDPQNYLMWRVDMRRLTAEEIRDSMISVTGALNPKMGGPSFFPTLPEEVLATSSTKDGKWGESSPEEENRRSVYIKIKRSLPVPQLTDFDFADTDSTCAARFVTTVPTQALGMLNSKFINDQAARFADRLEAEAGNDPEQLVARGLALVFCRPAQAEEIQHGLSLINAMKEQFELNDREALERFCLLALNLNEFIYLD